MSLAKLAEQIMERQTDAAAERERSRQLIHHRQWYEAPRAATQAREGLSSRRGAGGVEASVKYEIIIYWSPEDNALIAEVPELAGCMADGSTHADALRNVEQIAGEGLTAAQLT